MRLLLPADTLPPVKKALAKAGDNEIGGQLFGEQLAVSVFRVTEITIQSRGGTFARFKVDLAQAMRQAASFFRRTRHRYDRFNYIGEWHSHPNFAVSPSGADNATMQTLTTDRDFRGNFAVLMILRLDADTLRLGAWVFDRSGERSDVTLELDQ